MEIILKVLELARKGKWQEFGVVMLVSYLLKKLLN